MKKIRILIADDHTIVRQGLKVLLEMENDIEVVAQAQNGAEAVAMTLKHHPSIAVLDISMPELNGLQAAGQILKNDPHQKIIFLTIYENEEFIKHALDLNIAGYVVKQTAANELIFAIREIEKGGAYLSPGIAKIVLALGRSQTDQNDLTLREREVLELIVDGKTNKEISKILCISIKTVEKHRQGIMDKLNIHDVVGLTKYAIAKGII